MAAATRIELERALDQDMLLTSVGWANSYYQSDHDYVDEWGVDWSVIEYETRFGRGHYTEMTGHPLASDEAVASYRAPDPHREELYRDAAWTLREFQDEYWIVGVTVTTIFETAWALRGYERLLTDLVDRSGSGRGDPRYSVSLPSGRRPTTGRDGRGYDLGR